MIVIMAPCTRSRIRWFAWPLVVAQLLLCGAAVPHCHEDVCSTARDPSAGHPWRTATPHRHWAWGTHGHRGGHGHESSHAEQPPHRPGSVPAEHDSDAIHVVDHGLAVLAGRYDFSSRMATAWVSPRPAALAALPSAAGEPWRMVRPPGDRLPTLHDLLPHVLRV